MDLAVVFFSGSMGLNPNILARRRLLLFLAQGLLSRLLVCWVPGGELNPLKVGAPGRPSRSYR